MDDLVADESSGGRAVFRQCHGHRAQGAERRAGLGPRDFAVSEQRVEAHRHADVRDGPCPAPPHRVGHGHAHGRGLADPLLFDVRDESFKILDGHATGRATAGDARHVGGAQAEFVHPGLEPGREVARTRRVRRHGQTAHGRLNPVFPAAGFRV